MMRAVTARELVVRANCTNCARDIEGEVIHVSTDEGDFTFCRRCYNEEFVARWEEGNE